MASQLHSHIFMDVFQIMYGKMTWCLKFALKYFIEEKKEKEKVMDGWSQ